MVEDCKEYLASGSSITFRHIYREANSVAHRLAHLVSLSMLDDFWLDETPTIIEDVLFEDLSYCTRGEGLMSPSLSSSIIINK